MANKVFFTSDTHYNHANIIKHSRRTAFMSQAELDTLAAVDREDVDYHTLKISRESVERMNQKFIDNTNEVVGEDDVLYHLGDVFWGDDFNVWKAIRDRIKCKTIHHIWGNHDRPDVAKLFTSSSQYREVIVDGGSKVFLCHYPMRSWNKSHRGSICLYGHVHGHTCMEDRYGINIENEYILRDRFNTILTDALPNAPTDTNLIIDKLMQSIVIPKTNTLDVGVDTHNYKPWSIEEIRRELVSRALVTNRIYENRYVKDFEKFKPVIGKL